MILTDRRDLYEKARLKNPNQKHQELEPGGMVYLNPEPKVEIRLLEAA